MTERDFLRAIRDRPGDDGVRLVFADWLDEHGRPERAEFIRVQCELEPQRRAYGEPRADTLREREAVLLREHRDRWLSALADAAGDHAYGIDITFRRGFADTLTLPVQWYVEHGPAIHRRFPLLRRVELFCVAGWGEALADCPVPRSVAEVEIACWVTGADAAAVAGSARLRHLRRLDFWLGNIDDLDADAAICRALIHCAAWPRLRELRLVAVSDNPDARRPLLDTLAPYFDPGVATFFDPWSRPYAFAPDGYFFRHLPGRLPDGDQVFAVQPPGRPRGLLLLRFDADGNPLGERAIDLPDACAPPPTYQGTETERRLARARQEFLHQTLGHRPALIRVKDLRVAGERWVADYSTAFADSLGVMDPPEFGPETDAEDPGGRGAAFHRWIHTGSFVYTGGWGGDLWVNESGHVYAS